jgi:hypothetical protein
MLRSTKNQSLSTENFWDRVSPEPNSGCWFWLGGLNDRGYGIVGRGANRVEKAHRWFYRHFVGTVPPGLHVLHHCDVRCCVNPEHLYVGTHQDNMIDRGVRGRHARGEATNRTTLTEQDVFDIRHSGLPRLFLAEKYDISVWSVDAIKKRKRWGHL